MKDQVLYPYKNVVAFSDEEVSQQFDVIKCCGCCTILKLMVYLRSGRKKFLICLQ